MSSAVKTVLQGLLFACAWLLIIIVLPVLSIFAAQDFRKWSLKKHGDEVVVLIEEYKFKNGKLPNDLTELGLKEFPEEQIIYQKEPESEYIVFFGTTLGKSETYRSKRKKWDDGVNND
jgi:hypothetical protein